jgi:hypothetical protein
MANICVIVCYDDSYSNMAETTVGLNIKPYCEKHGYDIYIDRYENYDTSRAPQWHKIKVCIEVLQTNKYDWIFFIDIDCLIMNSSIKLESIIDNQYSFILPQHIMPAEDTPIINIPEVQNIITSQFFVKNDADGLSILNAIWNANSNIDINKFDYDGRGVRIVINSGEFNHKIKIVEEHLLNRFWYMNNPFMTMYFIGINDHVWKPKDFIVHVTGYKTEERTRLLSDINYFAE